MPWFKVDDRLYSHPKWVSISPTARALWITAGSWCAGQCNDGIVPRHMLGILGARDLRPARELVGAGLWEEGDEGAYVFHNWVEFQPSKADVEEQRRKARERMAEVRANKRRTSPEPNPNFARSSQDVRVAPSRPVPSPTTHVSTTPQDTPTEPVDDEMKQEAHRRTMAVARAGRLQGTFAAYERVVLAGLKAEGWKPEPPPPLTPQEALPDVETLRERNAVLDAEVAPVPESISARRKGRC